MENQELLLKFKESLRIKHYSPRSIASYDFCLKKLFNYLDKTNKSLKEVSKEDIFNYQAYLKANNYSPNTRERLMHSLKSLFKYLEQTFYILVNPTEGLILKRAPKRIPVVLTKQEVKEVLSKANTAEPIGLRDRAILEVLYSSGVRIGELYNLSIFDIDIDKGFLRVNNGKGNKDRVVPLTKAACYYLKEYLKKARPNFIKKALKEEGLFVGVRGRRLSSRLIAQKISQYAKAARIKKPVTTHTFRHTFATHLLENQVDIFKIQRLLGHTRASTTQIYTRVSPEQIKEAHSRCHPREQILVVRV